jgi:mannose-6-phosphate isomerase-like protein (cupin superfamily)
MTGPRSVPGTEVFMLVKEVSRVAPIPAADYTELRELLHPDRDAVSTGLSLAHAILGRGSRSLRHRLAALEIYYFLSGSGIIHIGDEEAGVQPGVMAAVPAGVTQWVENTGERPLEFLCIVEPAWQEEGEEILEKPASEAVGDA